MTSEGHITATLGGIAYQVLVKYSGKEYLGRKEDCDATFPLPSMCLAIYISTVQPYIGHENTSRKYEDMISITQRDPD